MSVHIFVDTASITLLPFCNEFPSLYEFVPLDPLARSRRTRVHASPPLPRTRREKQLNFLHQKQRVWCVHYNAIQGGMVGYEAPVGY